MIFADILFYFLIILGFYLTFLSYWLVAEALFAGMVEACRLKVVRSPLVSMLVGLVLGGPLLALGIALSTKMGNAVLQLIGLTILFFFALFCFIGSAGLCRQIGLGLGTPGDDSQPWRRVLRGGLILGISFLLPVVGWFAVMPLTFIIGFGAFIRALWSSPPKPLLSPIP